MSSSKLARPRTLRRAQDRIDQKLAESREKLFRLEAGGTPERPISVVSASLVEPRTKSTPCPRCLGELRVVEHTAETFDGDLLRVVRAKCFHCGTPRTMFFRIDAPMPS